MDLNSTLPLVSIGIPTYNRPEGLAQTLACMTGQSYTDLEIIVSDNCSPDDRVQDIGKKFQAQDSRVRYFRQKENIGPANNFHFVLGQARGDYFMWASDDDVWDTAFVLTGIQTLLKNPEYDAWCCTPNVIDRFGRCILEYPDFSRFTSTHDKRTDALRYVREPGSMGKPNIIYSIYRMEVLKATLKEYSFSDTWASDTAFNLAFLSRHNLIATGQILFHKRLVRKSTPDQEGQVKPIDIKNYNRFAFHPKKTIPLIRELSKAVKTTPFQQAVILCMISQIPMAVINYIISRFSRKTGSLAKRIEKAFVK